MSTKLDLCREEKVVLEIKERQRLISGKYSRKTDLIVDSQQEGNDCSSKE
jgi:hypothetical protein